MSAAFALVCVIGCVGGILVTRVLYARNAARARGIRLADAARRTLVLRDEEGGYRWFVLGWTVLWFAIWVVGTTR